MTACAADDGDPHPSRNGRKQTIRPHASQNRLEKLTPAVHNRQFANCETVTIMAHYFGHPVAVISEPKDLPKHSVYTIEGFEVMRALRKGQARPWCLQPGIRGEVRLVERAFGIGPSALTEVMGMLNHHFAAAA